MKTRFPPRYKFLITAGPTREYIDPVRFISNAATGTIGYLIAGQAREKGHEVILLSGPTNTKPPRAVKTVYFESALELKKMVDRYYKWADCVISTGAVSDFRPRISFKQKIKKKKMIKNIALVQNPDILKLLGQRKKNKVLIGFALETNNLLANARRKLKEKRLDFIVANRLSNRYSPFGDQNLSVVIIDKTKKDKFPMIKKAKLARIILDRAEKLCYSLKRKI